MGSSPSAATAPLVQSLTDTSGGTARLGGKGASLARLTVAGLPVPPGFVLTASAHRASTDPALWQVVSAEVREAYRRLGEPAVAVRSSATAEDLAEASFAGQLESYLDVRGADELLDAVRRCWASAQSARADAYRKRVGAADLVVAVVVQQMVAADAAGVIFTGDPVTGDASRIMINSVAGLGEALVSGTSDAEVFMIDKASGVITQTVHTQTGQSQTVSNEQVTGLVELALRIETIYARPMDIEWCRQGDELFVVQARPITTAAGPDPWNDTGDGDFLWTNTNVGEAVPDVMTPATWSMVQVFLTDAMATASIPPYVGYGRIGGRIYLNVSVMMTLSGAVGVNESRFRRLTAEVFGRLPDDLEIPAVPAHRIAVLRGVVPMGLHVLGEARRDVKLLDAYLDDHPRRCLERRQEIANVDNGPDLALLWSQTILPEFERVSWMLSAATRSSGAAFVTTRQRLQRLVGDATANALTAGLGAAAGQLASLGLLDGLELVAGGAIDRATFAEQYGHRGPHEFEISLPRPGEEPDWVDQQLVARSEIAVSHRELIGRQERARELAWADLRRRHRWQSVVLERQLARWAKISRDRERARSEVIRYFWVLRAYALRAGELSGLGGDIFFLESAEIVRVLDGETLNLTTIADRRTTYEAYCRLPSYPGLIRGRFHPYAWAADPQRRGDLYVEGGGSVVDAEVRGFPGSAGVVEGSVRVLVGVEEGDALLPGEVLVTTVTNVGWTPLFPRAGAVVTDVGAPLSHAAIVARELGIPAVVGCGNATTVLRTGDRGPGGRDRRDRRGAQLSWDLSGPVSEVAPTLLGAILRHGEVAVRLTEVEAYDGADDPASHAFRGPTPRNLIMFGPPGHLYVYFSYGMHWAANIACGPEGRASGVLLRAGQVVEGIEVARSRRGRASDRDLARGPGRLTQALGIGGDQKGTPVLGAGPVRLEPGPRPAMINTGPRVGVSVEADRPWRFWEAGSRFVSDYKRSPRAPSPTENPGPGTKPVG